MSERFMQLESERMQLMRRVVIQRHLSCTLMKASRPARFVALRSIIAAVLVGGACSSDHFGQPPELRVEDVSVVVSTESSLISRPADIAVDEDGQVYVLDNLAAQIVVLSADWELRQVIGREGSGPREFKRPMGITLGPDSIRVVDLGNGRLQTLSLHDEFTRTTALPLESEMGPVAVSEEGGFLAGTVGLHDALAAHYDPAGVRRGTFGIPPAPASVFPSFTRMKE